MRDRQDFRGAVFVVWLVAFLGGMLQCGIRTDLRFDANECVSQPRWEDRGDRSYQVCERLGAEQANRNIDERNRIKLQTTWLQICLGGGMLILLALSFVPIPVRTWRRIRYWFLARFRGDRTNRVGEGPVGPFRSKHTEEREKS